MPGALIPAVLRRRWLVFVVAAVLLFGLLLVVLPYGMQWAMHRWLSEHGVGDVAIDDIDFNVFTGRAAVEGLQLTDGEQPLLKIPRLEVDVDWLPLLSRQVIVRSVTVNGVALDVRTVEDGRTRIGGIDLPAGAAADEPDAAAGPRWDIGVDRIEIAGTEVLYRSADLDIDARLDDLQLTGIKTWEDAPARLLFSGSINGAPVSLDGELPPLSAGSGYRGQVSIQGFDLAALARVLAGSVDRLGGRVSAQTALDLLYPPAGALRVGQDGAIDVVGLELVQGADRVALERVSWDGQATFAGGPSASATATGGLGLARLDAAQAANRVALGAADWQGEASWSGGDDGRVAATGKLAATELAYDVDGSAARLASIGQLAAELALAAADDVQVQGLTVGDIALGRFAGEGAATVMTVKGLALDTADITAGGVALGTLALQGLVADLQRDRQGEWRIQQVLAALPAGDEQPADAAATPFRIAGITVGGDSAIALRDASVTGGFKTRAVINAAEVGAIDSAQPRRDTPVSISARTGKHSKIEIDGTVRPFAERVTLALDGKLAGIALTDISPYTTDALGYALQSGQLDATTSANIDAGKMKIDNRLILRGLEVKPVDNASRAKLDGQTSVPLNTALDMLRDKHNTIKLDLPVNGDIDNPEFDISDAINQAMGTALKKGSMTYLKYALQPYGALLTVAQLAGEAASKVRLDPVEFAAGETALPAARMAYLEKVAGILKERPEVNIKVCGVASQADNLAATGIPSPTAGGRLPDTILDEPAPVAADAATTPAPAYMSEDELLELAAARAAAVTDHLVTQHGIDAGRLVACQPALASTADGKGRVDLLI